MQENKDLLSNLSSGVYTIEIFSKITTTVGDQFLSNLGANYKATFTVADAGFNSSYAVFNNKGVEQLYCMPSNTVCGGTGALNNASLGSFCPAESLVLKGAELNVFKCYTADITATRLYYRVYPTGGSTGSFNSLNIDFNLGDGSFSNANGCGGQDQRWKDLQENVNILSGLTAGNYTIDIYAEASTNGGIRSLNNGGSYYKATFTVLPPVISAVVTPVSCFGGTNGAINLTTSCVVVTPPVTLTASENFNTLATTGTPSWVDGTTIANWFTYNAGTNSSFTTYSANSGTSTSGGLFSYGVAGVNPVTDRALGTMPVNALGNILGAWRITNTTNQTLTTATVNYTGEQWRNNGNTTPQTLRFDYQINASGINSGSWSSVFDLYFTSPINSATASALDGNAPANRTVKSATFSISLAPGQSIWLRWTDLNDVGNDHGLAIDDLSVTLSSAGSGVSYAWTGPGGYTATTEDISGLLSGDYTVTVTSANGTTTATYNVAQPTAISISEVVTNVSCNGGNNGAINISVSGGTGGYTFSWTNGATSEDISSLTAGNYTVTVTDGNGCKATKQIAVTQPPALSLSTIKSDVSCNGGSNGSINLTVNGNTSPYSYAWSNGATSEDVSSLSAGPYSVTVTDANGCTATTSVTINEPAAIVATYTASPILCKGGSSTVTIKATGGTGGYSGTGMFSQAAGTQTYTVTDANNCTASVSVTVTEPAELTLGTTKTDVSCNGGNTGAVNLTVTGGTPGVNITQNFNSLASSGTSSSIPVGWKFSELGSNANTLYSAGTGNSNTGDTYSFGSSLSTERALGGLFSGSLNPFIGFEYKNNTGHTITSINVVYYGEQWRLGDNSRTVPGPDRLDFVYSTDATSLTTGTWIDVDALDFTSPITTGAEGALDGNLAANRSLVSGTITGLNIPDGATVWIAWRDFNVSGSDDGLAIDDVSISYITGTPHYSYLWSNGATTEDISGLTAGNYSVTVTDANGCTANNSFTIDEPSAVSLSATGTNVSCNGANDGFISITSNGTVVIKDANENIVDATGLAPGTYTVYATKEGNNGATCSATPVVVIITQPDAVTLSATGTNLSCNGANDGFISTISNGTVVIKDANGNVVSATGLAAGTYTVYSTKEGNNGAICSATPLVVTLTEPDAVTLSATGTNVTCNGANDGSISATSNGTVVIKDANGNVVSATGLAPGTYTVYATNEGNNGATCSATPVILTITQPAILTASSTATVLVCPNGIATVTVSANGGTAPYSGTGNFVTGAGIHTFTVTDANGCTASTTITITPTNVAPVINSVTPSTVAPIALNGSVSITTNFTDNNVVSASVNWDDGSANQTVSNPASTFTVSRTYGNPGVYSVTITLTDGCGLTASYKYDYVVVYDPNGGFVTGGGWITSPAGAYVADASLAGKANFGFVAKYKKGTNVPDGNTEFQFHAGNFNFKSSAYDAGWLVISGYKATFRGTGTVNGAGNYGFLVSAIDGQKTGGGGYDKFRIKIWDKSNGNAVVYDNDMGLDENGLPTTAISGGSIVIHEVKKNTQTNTLPVFTGPTTNRFDVKVLGNPSITKFTLKLESSNFNDKITLKIVDVSGRIVEVKQNLYSGQVVEFGTDYKVGSYFAEVVQGDQRKVIKLIKASRD